MQVTYHDSVGRSACSDFESDKATSAGWNTSWSYFKFTKIDDIEYNSDL